MYVVGRLGSYITQGVYTVSGPFHPFGGAVDIIVVEQQDGTFKSSPWYVRFGKFQGVLTSKEKVVDISVDGVKCDFHMYLDHRGQAYFLREVECEDGDSLLSPSSSGEEMDELISGRRPLKSKSCNYDSPRSDSIRKSHLLGRVFGRNSMKENSFREEEDESSVLRADSLDRAEIAADLLEVKWSTYLAFGQNKKDVVKKFSHSHIPVNKVNEDPKAGCRSRLRFQNLGSINEDFGVEMCCLYNELQEENYVRNSQTVRQIDGLALTNADGGENFRINIFEEFSREEEIGACEDLTGAVIISGVNSFHETGLKTAKEPLDCAECLVYKVLDKLSSDGRILDETAANTSTNISTETCAEDPINVLINLSEPCSNCVISDPKNAFPQEIVSLSGGSEEEQHLFGEYDDFNCCKVDSIESIPPTQFVKVNEPLVRTRRNEEEILEEKPRAALNSISIPRRDKIDGEVIIGRMAESLPNMWPPVKDVVLDDLPHPLCHSLDSNFNALVGMTQKEELSNCINPDAEKLEVVESNVEDPHVMKELNNIPAGDPSKGINPSNGSWRVWPFSFKRSKSMNSTGQIKKSSKSLDAECNLESSINTDGERHSPKPTATKKKKVRVLTPTPDQLASLNLKGGKNTVTFTFSTSMLGSQKVDARIYLWKWDTRVVISDVDGTITKSDVLGQFMPMVGMDWSQTGVAHLYSAIKENGYQLLFLSARAISQAYHTRQFLFNLKQDGKALPDGPVVISPDGLVPSLFREVIRRAPHEFKIACLEDIKALFPSDRCPFYAGFGNRDTDEISYLKVGIPKGKIFIINPKGEIVVNHRVDRKSYTSLKALVHDIFPPMSSSEQEDFNSWNYWKLPPPVIDA